MCNHSCFMYGRARKPLSSGKDSSSHGEVAALSTNQSPLTPRLVNKFLSTASAIGERQMLAKHTNKAE